MSPTRVPPSPAAVARGLWRRLRTMRTAIVLLLLLGMAAAVGSFFPQRPIEPTAVDRWIESNPSWAGVAEFFGLFDVFGAWWFMLIYGLLLVSLVGCLIPRYRAFVRMLRAKPYVSASLAGQPLYQARDHSSPPEELLGRAERALRARRFRTLRAGDLVAAERGNWREGGSLLFHTAFLVLLLGMSVGKLFGYTGQVAVVEGERFTDTPIEYDFLDEGRYFGSRYRGFELELQRFDVSWYPNGVPKKFASAVRLFQDGRLVRTERIVVNSPLTYGSVRIYQVSWGWAPHLRIEQRGRVLYDGPTMFLQRDGSWYGVAKVPQTEPQQMGLEMLFFTDPVIGPDDRPGDASPEPRRPIILFQQLLGDLQLDRPQSVFRLDPRLLVPAERGALEQGGTATLPGDITVTFVGLRQYSVFQIASNPGALLLLIAAVLILVGLIPALYSARRRVWVRATPDGAGARLEIAGHALQRKAAFETDFTVLVGELVRDDKVPTGVPSG